jgi:hypothetical protein
MQTAARRRDDMARLGPTLVQRPYGHVLNGFDVTPDGHLRFGSQSVPLSSIQHYAPRHHQERDVDSVLTTVAVFMAVAAVLLILVVEMGWRARFLVGAGLFASIAIAAIVDLMRTMRIELYRLEIKMADGGTAMFVTPDAAMLNAMMMALETHTGLKPKLVTSA